MRNIEEIDGKLGYAIEAPHIQDLGVGTVTSDCVATHVLVQNRPSICEDLHGVYVESSV